MNVIWYGEIKDFNTLIEQKKKKIQPTACTSEQHRKIVFRLNNSVQNTDFKN